MEQVTLPAINFYFATVCLIVITVLYTLLLRKTRLRCEKELEEYSKEIISLKHKLEQREKMLDRWKWDIREVVDSFLNDVHDYHKTYWGDDIPDIGPVSFKYVENLQISWEEYKEFYEIYMKSIQGHHHKPDIEYLEPGGLLQIIHDVWHGSPYKEARDKAYEKNRTSQTLRKA